MTIKAKFHLDSQKIEDRKQRERESNFSVKTVKLREKKSLWLKHTHTTQHNGISQPTELPIYSKTKNLFKAGIFI